MQNGNLDTGKRREKIFRGLRKKALHLALIYPGNPTVPVAAKADSDGKSHRKTASCRQLHP